MSLVVYVLTSSIASNEKVIEIVVNVFLSKAEYDWENALKVFKQKGKKNKYEIIVEK